MNFGIKTVNYTNETSLGKDFTDYLKEEEDYKTYFAGMMKKHGYKSIAEIPPEKKKEFFNAVDAGWKGKKENGGEK